MRNKGDSAYFAWCCDGGISETQKAPGRWALDLLRERTACTPSHTGHWNASETMPTLEQPWHARPHSLLAHVEAYLANEQSIPHGVCLLLEASKPTDSVLPSGIGSVPESITFQGGKLAGRHILLTVFRVSMKDSLCSQKTILPSNQSLEDPLIPAGPPPVRIMPPLPLRTPCGPSLIPPWSFPLLLHSHWDNPPDTKTPNFLQALSPGGLEITLWFPYCKEFTLLVAWKLIFSWIQN